MRRLLKLGLLMLIPPSLAVFQWSAQRPPPSKVFTEGVYVGSGWENCRIYELRGGRFKTYSKAHPERIGIAGPYQVDGSRIRTFEEKINIFKVGRMDLSEAISRGLVDTRSETTNPTIKVLHYRVIGGVAVILKDEGLKALESGSKINERDVYVLADIPERHDQRWWIDFLNEHPKFAATMDPVWVQKLPWWELQRWRAREYLRSEHPNLYQGRPEWMKQLMGF